MQTKPIPRGDRGYAGDLTSNSTALTAAPTPTPSLFLQLRSHQPNHMALQKHVPASNSQSLGVKPLRFSSQMDRKTQRADASVRKSLDIEVDIDLREVYFLIMHFLSSGPCQRTCGQLWNELLEHNLLPRRYHAWYSRCGVPSGNEHDDGLSFPLSYNKLVERYNHVETDHLVKLLKQLILSKAHPLMGMMGGNAPNAADIPTLLGVGSFSLLSCDEDESYNKVRGLSLREIGGGFTRHQRAPSTRAACNAIAKPSTMVQKMQNIKKTRGHRNAVYCATLDRSGRFVITGSDDRLVKIWSMETAFCLASCRGHEGDITDLAVNSNNTMVASSSNDCVIRVWRIPDGLPVSVLHGHTGGVTAIAFSPRSNDGVCRLWDARSSQIKPKMFLPRPQDSTAGRSSASVASSSSATQQSHQIFCCSFNASGTVFVTGSSDSLARVWNACKFNADDPEQLNYEMDVLSGHENDVNYVQFSGSAVSSRALLPDTKEDKSLKFKNSWFAHDNIVTCSRDGSAIIWVPRSRKSHGKSGRWTRAYHLKVPPPPMPPQPPRGGPRQRVLPTPRGVNMIVWSLDNRFVLAALMDCRICVWNAADGSLVHSLTGHTESTYVLDVHPFNPRMAMSAGYDGKIIVWDIWEGKPIRIYETGPYRLVDGKFSPDGTSIVVSDDVGQLYILSTGQGEAQKDAKYDQFFLGDYRPLIHDTSGNVVDQETQLVPYRRNIQDLLCDSGIIPYEEPYQSMYQQRRLGTLGHEWRPSSVRFAIGPDFNSDQGYQIPPLVDMNVLIDPLPEFAEVMDWEPDIEIQSDDSDSEYNATEEFSVGGDEISITTSGDSECSGEDSENENGQIDSLRRSKRKKDRREIEITTSSGRRVKRRNLDEYEENLHKIYQTKKIKNVRKVSRKKPSSSKTSRPRRAAARNALSLFSKINGTSPDGENGDCMLLGDSSDSDSALQDSDFDESEESEKHVLDNHLKQLKGKEILLDDSEDSFKPQDLLPSQSSGSRKRLVFKLPVRDPNENSELDDLTFKNRDMLGLLDPCTSSYVANETTQNGVDGQMIFYGHGQVESGEAGRTGGILDLSRGYKNGNIRWGGVRARTSKRPKLSETTPSVINPGPSAFDLQNESSMTNRQISSDFQSSRRTENDRDELHSPTRLTKDHGSAGMPEVAFRSNGFSDFNGLMTCGFSNNDNIRSNGTLSSDPCSSSNLNITVNNEDKEICCSPPCLELKPIAEELQGRPGNSRVGFDDGNLNGVQSSNGVSNGKECSSTIDSECLRLLKSDRMYSAVYRRSKRSKTRTFSGADGPGNETASNARNVDSSGNAKTDSAEPLASSAGQSDLEQTSGGMIDLSIRASAEAGNNLLRRCDKIPLEESASGMKSGLRSARNRRSTFTFEATSVDKRRLNQSQKKVSWLMLSVLEGSRYIPQQGDEVVYVRQGHEEYITSVQGSERGPWQYLRGQINSVEYCRVTDLEYSTLPGSGDSCCKMTLEFVDPGSEVFGKTFKLTLPETSFPDFLVERTRYDAALQRNWTARDKCQVWWKTEGEEDGNWWEGRIVGVKDKSKDFPDSPWERYAIRYKSDPGNIQHHSPWELFDSDTQWEQPHIDEQTRTKLLASLDKLEQSGNRPQDNYGVQKLKQAVQKSSFLNRFPVPLSLDVIRSRLENNYYRSLEAVRHDVKVMLMNAESYFVKSTENSAKAKRLSEWFAKMLSSLPHTMWRGEKAIAVAYGNTIHILPSAYTYKALPILVVMGLTTGNGRDS
ncbi:hypothetical protein V2J09_017631 [Rumex salicifolius]